MRKLICMVLIALVLSFFSCEKKEHSQNHSLESGVTGTTQPAPLATGPYALEITPKEAWRDSTVTLSVTGFSSRDAKIVWLLNGAPEESGSPDQFTLSGARKGDTLQAKALMRDREVLSNKIEIVNAPPKITGIKLIDQSMKPGGALGVAVTGSDADGDSVTFLYEWTINGKAAGTGERIEGQLKRGDVVVVKVTPYDGESYGRSIELTREIQNLPPVIQEHREFQFDGTRYTCQVKASDPDGDPLTYAIESPETGMMIDTSRGLLTWDVPAEFKGKKSVSVVVTDGHGGTARCVLNITLQ